MTPRLKILTAGLVLSLIYAISDYITRNSDKPVVEVKREVKKRPKTARVDVNRIATIRAKAAKNSKLSGKWKNHYREISKTELLEIPERVDQTINMLFVKEPSILEKNGLI